MIDSRFRILSDEAAVISGRTQCWNCGAEIGVICLYCQTGFVAGEAMCDFSVSNITDVDEALRLQLGRWPRFHPTREYENYSGGFSNHCANCEVSQDDFHLHSQPGGIFFSFQHPATGDLQIQPLQGMVRLTGDEGFEL